MGANAQTSVPTFTAGDVLTAANMNISARTGVPVFASTVTRDAGFGGTGEKTLAEGQMCYVEGTGFQTYDGTSWITWGTAPADSGLTLISSTTIGTTVSSVAVSNCFSATYDNYKITVNGGSASASGGLSLQLGSTTTGYYAGSSRTIYGGAGQSLSDNNAANWTFAGQRSSNGIFTTIELLGPFTSTRTMFTSASGATDTAEVSQFSGGFLNNTTSYTGFTLLPSAGTLTGGTIRVYGYKN